jgi:hypothetical protein
MLPTAALVATATLDELALMRLSIFRRTVRGSALVLWMDCAICLASLGDKKSVPFYRFSAS